MYEEDFGRKQIGVPYGEGILAIRVRNVLTG